ncbi:hypothetical protein E2562_034539, partial [Oryza meyeriana var. granulata]
MAEAVLLAVKKVGNVLADEAAKSVIAKVSEKVTNLKELPEKVEDIRKQLTIMNSVIRQIGTSYLTDIVVKDWIAEVRKLAYRVEDVMDKYSYHALQLEEEGFLKKYFVKGSHYVVVFSDIAEEVVKLEKEIQQVIKLKKQWLHPSQLNPNHLADSGRQRSHDSFPDLVKDEDLVGFEGNRRLLTGWLYSDEPDRAVITVSGIGGLGKTTLVTNVYDREKPNFAAHAWIVVSQTYTVEALLRKLLRKIGSTELLFPEDYTMTRESLVRLWVAEGFVLSKEKNTPEDVAEGNLMELIHRNMLEIVENDEVGRVNTCKMHDIVRVLALSIAKEERFGSANDVGTMLLMDKEVRRLSTCGWSDHTVSTVKFMRLRTLISLSTISSSPEMLSSIMSGSTYLTVLELQDSEITEVPTSVGNMFNLRYIGLRRTKVKSLPESIGKLSNLHTLDIKQTKIEKLPQGIVKVKKLRHLLADRYADEKQSDFRYFIGMQAPKELSNLQELQTLETVESSQDLAEQLKKL